MYFLNEGTAEFFEFRPCSGRSSGHPAFAGGSGVIETIRVRLSTRQRPIRRPLCREAATDGAVSPAVLSGTIPARLREHAVQAGA